MPSLLRLKVNIESDNRDVDGDRTVVAWETSDGKSSDGEGDGAKELGTAGAADVLVGEGCGGVVVIEGGGVDKRYFVVGDAEADDADALGWWCAGAW